MQCKNCPFTLLCYTGYLETYWCKCCGFVVMLDTLKEGRLRDERFLLNCAKRKRPNDSFYDSFLREDVYTKCAICGNGVVHTSIIIHDLEKDQTTLRCEVV